jgi:xylulokinase
VGAGVWRSVADTASEFAEYDLEYLPEKNLRAMYDGMLAEYKLLMKELAPSFKRAV